MNKLTDFPLAYRHRNFIVLRLYGSKLPWALFEPGPIDETGFGRLFSYAHTLDQAKELIEEHIEFLASLVPSA